MLARPCWSHCSETGNIDWTSGLGNRFCVYHGCLLFTKSFSKIRLEGKWVVPAENFRVQRNIWKGTPVLSSGNSCTNRVSLVKHYLWYQFQTFAVLFRKMELICTNGKSDSGTKYIGPEFCVPFAQTVNRPVCPCQYIVNNSCLLGVQSACLFTNSFSGFSQGCAPTCRCCISRMGWFCLEKNIRENIVVFRNAC